MKYLWILPLLVISFTSLFAQKENSRKNLIEKTVEATLPQLILEGLKNFLGNSVKINYYEGYSFDEDNYIISPDNYYLDKSENSEHGLPNRENSKFVLVALQEILNW